MRISLRKRAAATTVAAAVLGGGLATGLALAPAASAAGAAAAPRGQVIDGSGSAANDWGDEGTLSRYRHRNSNATVLWQYVLFADGAKWRNGNGQWKRFKLSDIDARFGPRTESATRWWQRSHELEDVDGVVGRETFGEADQRLSGPGQYGSVVYTGSAHAVGFKRVDGSYRVRVNGAWRPASYDRLG